MRNHERPVTVGHLVFATSLLLFTNSFILYLNARHHNQSIPEPTTQPTTTTRHMKVTAYCPCSICCGRWADGMTASGKPITANGGRFVAADRALPFGTLVVVPGYADGKPVPVLDRGGAICGDRLDVFFPSHGEALDWGVRWLDVQIGG
jgi:3D (Asp-Asp-Asp) domain-containing protein